MICVMRPSNNCIYKHIKHTVIWTTVPQSRGQGAIHAAIWRHPGMAFSSFPWLHSPRFLNCFLLLFGKKKKKPFTMFNQDDDTDCNSFLLLPWNISLKHFYCNLIYHKLGKRTKKNSCWLKNSITVLLICCGLRIWLS